MRTSSEHHHRELACPLTPAQIRLLQAAVNIGSTSSKDLARAMGISHHTVDSEWRSILGRLAVHDRGSAGMFALAHEWITGEMDEDNDARPGAE